MNGPDGSVIIDTSFDTSGVDTGTKEIENTLVGLKDSIALLPKAIKDIPKIINYAFSSISKNTENVNSNIKSTTTESEKDIVGLKDSLMLLPQAIKDIPNIISHAFKQIPKSVNEVSPSLNKLQKEIKRYEDSLKNLKSAGYGLGDAPYDKAYAGLQKAKESADNYRNTLLNVQKIITGPGNVFSKISALWREVKKQTLGVDNAQKKANKSGKQLNKTVKDTKKSTDKSGKGLLSYIKTVLKYSIGIRSLFVLFNRIRSAITEGMGNLAQYSNDTNKALSRLMSAMTRLKNSFAAAFSPLVQFVEPALTRFINHLSKAVTYLGKLFAALTGKDYFEQAIEVQQDYAESLDKTKDSAKKTQKQLAAFDELNVLDFGKDEDETDKSELKPEDMFQTVQIESNIKAAAQRIKAILAGLFGPLKQSWDENGPYVLDSLKYTASSIKQLASDMGSSFMQVWNAESYGKKITDDLLITFGNLSQTVGNLTTQFDKAWVSGDTGTNILRHLGDNILEVTGFFRSASDSIKNWSKTIDFSPLLRAFDGVLVSLTPIVSTVGDALLWLLENVLEPISKWGIEQLLPEVLNVIAAALRALKSVIDALKPTALWLWESFLKPLGEWTGDLIIAAFKKLVEWLNKFSDWVGNNQEKVKYITILIISFFAAWKITKLISEISLMITAITTLAGILSMFGISLTSIIAKLALGALQFMALTAAITGVIAVIAILATNWSKMSPSEKIISSILAAAAAVGVLAVALGAVKGAAGAAIVAAALAAGIAAATIAINAGKRQVATYQSAGGSSRSTYPTSAYSAVPYRMPRLATGTVVPPRAGEFAAILGDNKRETEVVSPLSTMKQALKEALFESGMNGNGNIEIKFTGDLAQLARILRPQIEMEGRRVGVSMVEGG